MRVPHFDRIELRLDRSTLTSLPGGAMQVDGVGAHVGLYTYHDDKGAPFVELVPRETLFDADSLATVRNGAPDVTIRHPSGLVNPDNWREVSHGTWVDAWEHAGDQLGVRLVLKTEDAKSMVRGALERGDAVELSPGYEVDVAAEPGRTEHGRHDAVQRNRVYNHIALLGPGEARGGPQMRLQLDGPVCAPEGCRIQLARVPRSDAREGTHMQAKITHNDGRSVQVDAKMLAWLLGASKVQADAIETATLTVEREGEEPTVLMLPVAMVEMMLEGVGAAPAPAAEPEGMEMSEQEMAEAVDADDGDDAQRGDSLEKRIAAIVDQRLRKHDSVQRARAHADARAAEVSRHAARLQIDATEGKHWTQTALDAICKAAPSLEADTRKLAARAAKGDSVAEGMLRERLMSLAVRADSGGSMTPGKRIVHKRAAKGDGRAPWNKGQKNTKESN
jgi:hypothetical protein